MIGNTLLPISADIMGYYGYPDFQHSHVDTKMACPLQKNSVQNLVSSLYTLVEKGIPPLWIVTSGNPKKICIIDEWPELVDQAFVHQNFGHEKNAERLLCSVAVAAAHTGGLDQLPRQL